MGTRRHSALRRSLVPIACAASALAAGCGGSSSSGAAISPPVTYAVGGMVAGLGSGAQVALSDNGQDVLLVQRSGAFTFGTRLAAGAHYLIAVQTQPAGMNCTVANGSGTMLAAPVSNVMVACSASVFTVGGTVSGVTTSGLVLANGTTSLMVAANASTFRLPAAFASGAAYDVTIKAHPPGRSCSVAQGSGVVGSANVSDVSVACVPGAESVLHAFPAAVGDGSTPYGSLLRASDGSLYGLTYAGGANDLGVAFRVAPDGSESVLHSFGAGADGANPHGRLIQGSDGNLYGLTSAGGDYGHGVAFMLTPSGAETVLHSFGTGAGAQDPYGSLLQGSDGNFYGMSMHGGANGLGSVFMLRPDGSELVIYSFSAGGDGQTPHGSLIQANDGRLYGMTTSGGAYGNGTAFSVTLQGAETVLHSFGASGDGATPSGGLVQASDGNFYALTSAGGANGLSAAVRIGADGTEMVLASFGAGHDGANPSGTLLMASDGNFYALASGGGANGAGAVLQLAPGGAHSVLYSFGGGADGAAPSGSLIEGPDATLYGMTSGDRAGGTVFQID